MATRSKLVERARNEIVSIRFYFLRSSLAAIATAAGASDEKK